MNKYLFIIGIALNVVPLYAADQKSNARVLWTQTTKVLSAIPKPVRYIGGGAMAGYGGSILASQIASSRLTWITTGAGLGAYAYYKADDFALVVQRYRLAYTIATNMECVEKNMRNANLSNADIVAIYNEIKADTALQEVARIAHHYPTHPVGKSAAAPAEHMVPSGTVGALSTSSAPSVPTAVAQLTTPPSPKSATTTGGMGTTNVVTDHFNGAHK